MSFGLRLKELRTKRNVTQQQLADYIGVGRTAIAGYETKDKCPDFDKLRLIAKFFNVTTDYLLEIDNNEKRLDNSDTTIATHRVNFGEDLPEEAYEELESILNYIRHKYKKD